MTPSDRLQRINEIERIHNATVEMIGASINSSEGSLTIDPELEFSLNREKELLALARQPEEKPEGGWRVVTDTAYGLKIGKIVTARNGRELLQDAFGTVQAFWSDCGPWFYESDLLHLFRQQFQHQTPID